VVANKQFYRASINKTLREATLLAENGKEIKRKLYKFQAVTNNSLFYYILGTKLMQFNQQG
jgi:hypothetical protein